MDENQPNSETTPGATIRERVAKKARRSRKKAGEGKGEKGSGSKRPGTRKSPGEAGGRAPRRLSDNELEALRERLRRKFH